MCGFLDFRHLRIKRRNHTNAAREACISSKLLEEDSDSLGFGGVYGAAVPPRRVSTDVLPGKSWAISVRWLEMLFRSPADQAVFVKVCIEIIDDCRRRPDLISQKHPIDHRQPFTEVEQRVDALGERGASCLGETGSIHKCVLR